MAGKSLLFQKRTAGVLLHPTSLPCSESCWGKNSKKAFGTLGKDAYHFIDNSFSGSDYMANVTDRANSR
jgi:4-alpha-glucanotransferase